MLVVFSGYSGFIHQWNWPPRYNWNIVASSINHHYPSPLRLGYEIAIRITACSNAVLSTLIHKLVMLCMWCFLIYDLLRKNILLVVKRFTTGDSYHGNIWYRINQRTFNDTYQELHTIPADLSSSPCLVEFALLNPSYSVLVFQPLFVFVRLMCSWFTLWDQEAFRE